MPAAAAAPLYDTHRFYNSSASRPAHPAPLLVRTADEYLCWACHVYMPHTYVHTYLGPAV